eukprot:1486844-Pleurochrysis_carterae.AAC.1
MRSSAWAKDRACGPDAICSVDDAMNRLGNDDIEVGRRQYSSRRSRRSNQTRNIFYLLNMRALNGTFEAGRSPRVVAAGLACRSSARTGADGRGCAARLLCLGRLEAARRRLGQPTDVEHCALKAVERSLRAAEAVANTRVERREGGGGGAASAKVTDSGE